MTWGMKMIALCVGLFIFCFVIFAVITSPVENQTDGLEQAKLSCPSGLQSVEFREGSTDIEKVVCK